MSSLDAFDEQLGTVRSDGRSQRWNGHREQRKSALLLSAIDVLDESGGQITVETTAAAAHVSRTVVHRYFGGRDGLTDALAQRLSEAMLEVVDSRLADLSLPSERDRIASAATACIEVLCRYPNRWAFMREFRGGVKLHNLYEQIAARAVAALSSARNPDDAGGQDSQEEQNLSYIAQGLVGLVDFAGRAWRATEGASPADFADSVREPLLGILNGVIGPE